MYTKIVMNPADSSGIPGFLLASLEKPHLLIEQLLQLVLVGLVLQLT